MKLFFEFLPGIPNAVVIVTSRRLRGLNLLFLAFLHRLPLHFLILLSPFCIFVEWVLNLELTKLVVVGVE